MSKNTEGEVVGSKESVIKLYWDAMEIILKSLKSMTGNTTCRHIMNDMWNQLDAKAKSIRGLDGNDLIPGRYYQIKTYDKEFLVCRLEGFIAGDEATVQVRVLACSKLKWNYNDVSDYMILTVNGLTSDLEMSCKEDALELPLYMGYEFRGKLMEELLKKKGA